MRVTQRSNAENNGKNEEEMPKNKFMQLNDRMG